MQETKLRKLNLGCGFDYRQGYVNVDMHERHKPDVVANVLDLASFPTGFYEELIAQDVLEHVTRDDVRKALFEWNRVLALGGKIFIRTTELGGLVRLLEAPENQTIEAQERLVQNIFGTQAYQGDFHLSGFTERLFRYCMWEAGFEIDSMTLHYGAFLDSWAHKTRHIGFEDDQGTIDEAFLQRTYQQLLGRPPSAAELTEPGSRRELIRRLLLSEERRNAMRSKAPHFSCTLHQPALSQPPPHQPGVQGTVPPPAMPTTAAQPGILRRVARRAKGLVKSALAPLR